MSLLTMSVSGSVMVLVVIVMRVLLLDRLPKSFFLALWGAVLLRLLLPFYIPSPLSIYNLFSFGGHEVTNLPTPPGVSLTAESGVYTYSATVGSPPVSSKVVVWSIGALLTVLSFAYLYFRTLKELKTSLPCESDFVSNWLDTTSLKRSIQVRVLDKAKSPLTYGIFRPIIILPRGMEGLDEQRLTAILTHEYIHIKGFDSLKKLIMLIALSIHWFNPLVWVMLVLVNRDIELACDEQVLRLLGNRNRADYALTLVEFSEGGSIFSTENALSRNALEERIRSIMKHKRVTVLSVVVAVLLTVCITTVFATSKQDIGAHNQTVQGATSVVYSDQEVGTYNASELSYNDSIPMVEWYTYDEYKAFIEEEKLAPNNIIGEKSWNSTEGWYIWTEERVNSTIAMYEENLEAIKSGTLISKTVDDTEEVMMSYDSQGSTQGTGR